jgi:hypothetical protein
MKTKLLIVILALCACVWVVAQAQEESQKLVDPGKPDQILLDSLQAKAGQSIKMGLQVLVDDETSFDGKTWSGVGSFCIPLKYNPSVIKLDSVIFRNMVNQWDEKFTNKGIDTGFVSLAGIYTLKGAEKPAIISPDKPLEIATFFMQIKAGAKPGKYTFELTKDPLQGGLYFGSIDGYHSWKPAFTSGKVIVVK